MSDNNAAQGQHPVIPQALQVNPYAPPQPFQPAQPVQHVQPYQQSQAHQQIQPYQQAQGYQLYAAPRPSSGLAITALITGIGGIVLSWTFVALLASIVAVITGHMALSQIRRNPALSGRGMAIAGLILGYAGVALLVIMIVIALMSILFIGSIGFLPFLLM